ncbi:helix-turn-helix transcriptional regulator [Albimonas sp. CAU 1670]|uniref:helix-turn-helix domain-containing protein n=1 Tax=Albimonas sp. CAU 1670 TaxID=3032599 RepID=UPI0023DCE8C1|nr:helix-turn-helix transcriptional regulator [Albimonas sp. CAU 1670]MDF2234847.1 helix-turn-helix transcriptional regulator [Albimonas sp. CAU 1670]
MKNDGDRQPQELDLVAERLVALREALGMKSAHFADVIGVDRSSYSKIESGKKPLLPPVALKIWKLFGVDMNFIYLGQIRGLPESLSSTVTQKLTKRS